MTRTYLGALVLSGLIAAPLVWPVPATAEEEPTPEEISRIRIEGSSEVAFTPPVDSEVDVVEVELRQDVVSSQFVLPFLAVIGADGVFRFDVDCHFIGNGALVIDDPADLGQDVLSYIPVECVPSPQRVEPEPEPEPSRFQVLALTASEPPLTVPGEIVSWAFSSNSERWRQVTYSSGSTRTDRETVTESNTFDGSQVCFRRVTDCERCQGNCLPLCCLSTGGGYCGSPGVVEICYQRSGGPSETDLISMEAHDIVGGTSTSSSSLQQSSSFEMEWEFDLPSGVQIGTVFVFASRPRASDDVFYSLPLESHEMTLKDGPTVVPRVTGLPSPSGTCFRKVDRNRFLWEFPFQLSGNRVTLSMSPTPTCEFQPGGFSTRLTASFNTRGVEGGEVILDLEPEDTSVAVSSKLVGFQGAGCDSISNENLFGSSSTEVRASLSGAPASSTFTVRVTLDSFDAGSAGHTHAGPPPQPLWGTIGGSNQASCQVTTDAQGAGFCDLTYQAERVSGSVSLSATVDGMSDLSADAEIQVEVGGLGLLGPSSEGVYLLTGADPSRHPVNHYGTANTVRGLQIAALLYRDFLTGLRLGINDMSLARGGIFDFEYDWDPPHCSHRNGVDADIDRARFDETGASVVTVNCPDDTYLEIAAQAGGARLYCESGGRKHLDFAP